MYVVCEMKPFALTMCTDTVGKLQNRNCMPNFREINYYLTNMYVCGK